MRKTVVIGATPNTSRYAFAAASSLHKKGHEFVPVGIKKGEVLDKPILNLRERPEIRDVDTVTLYLSPTSQSEWQDYILSLNPKRIIFNPGTENPELMNRARSRGIEALAACTLTMLSVGLY